MSLPTLIPQDPDSRAIMSEMLSDSGVMNLNAEDAKEFILRSSVTFLDWMATLRALNKLPSNQRDLYFKQVFADLGEYDSIKSAAFLMLNLPNFEDHVLETLGLFYTLTHLLLGKEPEE